MFSDKAGKATRWDFRSKSETRVNLHFLVKNITPVQRNVVVN